MLKPKAYEDGKCLHIHHEPTENMCIEWIHLNYIWNKILPKLILNLQCVPGGAEQN